MRYPYEECSLTSRKDQTMRVYQDELCIETIEIFLFFFRDKSLLRNLKELWIINVNYLLKKRKTNFHHHTQY